MSNWGAGLQGFASGLSGGLALGQRLNGMVEDDKLTKVREQGIAEARALQAKAAPQVQDLGDQQNLTSNPQMSRDPNAAPEPVNTSLQQFQNNAQAQQDGGPTGVPVAQPGVQDTSALSSQPLASAAPGAKIAEPDAPSPFANGLTPQSHKRFNVDGQGFDSREEADAAAKAKTPALSDYYGKTLVPKMKEALMAQGKVEEAERWEKFATDEKGRKYGETWLKAVQLSHQGDYDGAAGELIKLHPHFEDGYDLVSAKPDKGPDGTSGFTMRVRGPDGNVTEMFQNSRTLVEMGAPQLSPINAFQMMEKRQTAVDTLAAKEAIDERNDKRTYQRTLDNTIQRDKDAAARAAQKAKDDAAKAAEADKSKMARQTAEDEAKSRRIKETYAEKDKLLVKKLEKEGGFKKGASPEDTARMVWQTLSANDMKFNKLPDDEKKMRVANAMASFKDAAGMVGGGKPKNDQPAAASAAPAGKRAVEVYDPATGGMKTVYR